MNTIEFENLLRTPPRPQPPAHLRERLLAEVDLSARNTTRALSGGGWLRRWWPTLLPAAAALGAVSVLTFQGVKIRSVKDSIAAHSGSAAALESQASGTADASSASEPSLDQAAVYEEEIARLKAAVAEATTQVAQLEQLRAANEKLKSQLAALPDRLSPEESGAMDEARERALSISCINNLKQFGLAVRVWGLDHNEAAPPDVLSMSDELGSPKILWCPADKSRTPATSFSAFTPANCSYEYLTPSAANVANEPERVLSRCPIHGHIGLCDGSVQGYIGKKHPDWLVEQNGKLYFKPRQE